MVRQLALTGQNRRSAIARIRKIGLTNTQKFLAEKGVTVSLGTLHNLAKLEGIKVRQGRPTVIAA